MPHSGPSRRDASGGPQPLRTAIRNLPAIQEQTAERARQIYFAAGSPEGLALEHWLEAEKEVLAWIDATLTCTSIALANITWPAQGNSHGGSPVEFY